MIACTYAELSMNAEGKPLIGLVKFFLKWIPYLRRKFDKFASIFEI